MELREMEKALASNIFTLRKEHGLSQEEVAKEIGVKQQVYALYEHGMRIPRLGILMRLASFYDISLDTIASFKPQKESYLSKFKTNLQILDRYHVNYRMLKQNKQNKDIEIFISGMRELPLLNNSELQSVIKKTIADMYQDNSLICDTFQLFFKKALLEMELKNSLKEKEKDR